MPNLTIANKTRGLTRSTKTNSSEPLPPNLNFNHSPSIVPLDFNVETSPIENSRVSSGHSSSLNLDSQIIIIINGKFMCVQLICKIRLEEFVWC